MINKNKFRISNDKKILHKIGKRWVTVSALTLALLGGGAVASTTITHADVTPTTTAQTNNSVKNTINANLHKATSSSAGVPKVSVGSASAQSSSATKPSAVQSQASDLHKGLMLNATKPSAKSSASSSNNDGMINLNMGTKSEQARSWNFVQHGINNNDYAPTNQSSTSIVNDSASGNQTAPVSSASAKSNVSSNSASKIPANAPINARKPFNSAMQSYEIQMSGADSEVASANAVNADSNSNKNEKNKALLKSALPDYDHSFIKGTNVHTGTDDGLNYVADNQGNVEFVNGTANSQISDLTYGHPEINKAINVKFDNVNTSNVTNMNSVFAGDSNIQTIDFGTHFDTRNASDMRDILSSDSNLQSITFSPLFDTSKAIKASKAFGIFSKDTNLQSLTINSPKTTFTSSDSINIPTTTSIKKSFGTYDGLNYVVNGSNVEFTGGTANSNLGDFIDKAPSDIQNATSIKFGNNIDTSKVTNMSDMFWIFYGSPNKLTSLDLGNNFNTSNVTKMNGMFSSIHHLHSLTLPNSFNTSKVTDMSGMFESTGLTSLTLPSSFDTSNVTDMNSMFRYSCNIDSLTIQSPKTKLTDSKDFNGTEGYDVSVPCLYKRDVNDNYTSTTPNDFSKGNVGTFVPENPAPSSDTATINFQDNDKLIKSYTTPKEKFGSTTTASNVSNTLSSDYQILNPGQTITYNGSTQNVAVKYAPNEWDTISYEYQPNSHRKDYYEVINQGQAYGRQGSNYTIQNSDVPKGYQLVNSTNSFTFGGSDGFHRIMIKPTTNTNIPAVPNTVNIKGTVNLHFSDDGKTRDIKLDYLTQDNDDKQINILNDVDYANPNGDTTPSDFITKNDNIQGFDVSNFTYTGATNNYDGTQYTPSKSDTDYNHGSTNLLVKNITLNFKAKNNTDPIQNGSTSTIEYIDNGKVISSQPVNSSTGSKIDPAKSVPKGYQVVSDNNGQKSFANDGSTHNVEIEGKTIPKTSITVKQSNGTTANIPVKNHKIGDKITINPNQYAPAGYQANPSDNPITVTIEPSDNKQGYSFKPSGNDTTPNAKNNVFNNNTVSYNYHYDPDKADNTVTVKYKNHSGQIVGTKTFNVPQGTKINPNSDTPSDYTDDGSNTKPITAASDGKQSTVIYNVKGSKTASQLPSTTNQGKVELHIVEKSNGNQVNSYNVQVDEGSKLVGSDFTIDPTQSTDIHGNKLVPKGYAPDGTDETITGVITNNGAVTDSGTDTLVYNAQGKQGYNIHYQNPSDPNDSSKDIVQPTNNDKTGQHLTNADVPHGYHLPSDTSYSFNSDGNIINDKTGQQVPDNRVPLVGDNIQGKANIVLKYQILDPTGKVVKTIYNNADDAQIILNGTVGGSEKINPWRYWKQDYTVPSNAQQSDTIHFTPSDVNANDENGQQFNPTLTYTATAQQAGDVVVQYVDTDNHDQQISQQDLGNFSDLVGQTVRLGQKEPSDNDANINNDSDVKYVLEVPQGYHLEYNANPITLAEPKMASNNPAVHYPKSGLGMLFNASRLYHRPVGLFLTVGLTRPATPKSSSASSSSANSVSSASSASDMSTSTNSASSLVDSLDGDTYITNNNTSNTSNITNNYNYSNSSTSTATNSDNVKANATSNANSARNASDGSGLIDINNRPSKIVDTTTTNKKHNSKVSNISKRLPMKNHYYVYSPKNIVLYGKHGAIKISRRKGFTGKILKITKFHGKRAFVISWKHKKFTVIAKQTKNAYIQPREYRRYAHGIIKHATIKLRKTSVIYSSTHFNKHTAKYSAKKGRKFTVVGIKSFGERGYKRTRFILSNGLIINANKNYVKFI